MNTYILTVKHDTGKSRIKVAARNLETAKQLLTSAEVCPAWAIINVKKYKK